MRRHTVRTITGVIAVLAFGSLAACGDQGATRLPDTTAVEVETGEEVSVESLADGRPTLAWFWAPHCPRCNAEAPEVEEFAASHPEIDVVGLGTQDDLALAREFRDRHDIEAVRLLWEDDYDSWQALGVPVQPAMILFDAEGERIGRRDGTFDEAEIRDAVEQL